MTEPVLASGRGTGDGGQASSPWNLLVFTWGAHCQPPWAVGHREDRADHCTPAALAASGAAGALGEDGAGSGSRQGPSPAAITLGSGSRDAVPRLPGLEAKDILLLSELLQTGTVLS